MTVIAFHELVRNSRPPIRATKNAAGQLPDRHHRCEPVRTASGLGWYVFLSLDFQLVFDGVEAIISLDEGENWYPLTTLQYPDFAAHFNEHAPTEAKGFVPPFIAMTEDPGIVQIWTGYIVKTAPDLSATRPCSEAVMLWLKAAVHSSKASDRLTEIMAKRCCIRIPLSRATRNIFLTGWIGKIFDI